MVTTLSRLLLLPLVVCCGATSLWAPLRKQLDEWLFTDNFAVSIGNSSHGHIFTHLKGNMTMTTKVETASTSKWPIAMMLTGLVKDGSIKSLDSKANEYVPWYVWYGGMWYIVKWYDTCGIFQFVFSRNKSKLVSYPPQVDKERE
jgi:hypothetical protein